MPEAFFKFPRTPHLFWPLERVPKDDRVLDPATAREFLSGDVIVEEKIDGANLGFSLDQHGAICAQNRGNWIERGVQPQFQPMWAWISRRHNDLTRVMKPGRILFGEWCFALHSVGYDRLPDWFLAFDVYDREAGRFWSTQRRASLFESGRLSAVPQLFRGRIQLPELQRMLQSEKSRMGSGPLEGLYIRRDGAEWLEGRAKLVRPEFLLGLDDHWSSRPLSRNKMCAPPFT